MNYTITDGGIVYHITPEHEAEEQQTDRLVDEWHAQQSGYTEREIEKWEWLADERLEKRRAILCKCGSVLFRVTSELYFCFMCDMYEDDLPDDISKDEYDEWFKRSWVDGVRMGPLFVRVKESKPMTQADALATINRISAEIEARDNVQPTQ